MYSLWADKWFYLTGMGLMASVGLLLHLVQRFKEASSQEPEMEEIPSEDSALEAAPVLEEKFDDVEDTEPSPQPHLAASDSAQGLESRMETLEQKMDSIQTQLTKLVDKFQNQNPSVSSAPSTDSPASPSPQQGPPRKAQIFPV